MYRQTFFAAISILLSLPMLSQQGYASQLNRTAEIAAKVQATVVQKTVHRPEWLKALKREEYKAHQPGYLGYSAYGMFTTQFPQHPVTAHKDLYNMHKHMLQNQLEKDQNSVLYGYTLQVTIPEMLTDLSVPNFGHFFNLMDDLAAGRDIDPVFQPEVSKPENAVIQLTVTVEENTKLILRMDAFSKNIYFFTNTVQK